MSKTMWIDPEKKRVDRSKDAQGAPQFAKVLSEVILEFLMQLDYTKMAFYTDEETGNVGKRNNDLRKAFSVFCSKKLNQEPNVSIENPLENYVYVTDVYEDAYDMMFEYIGEVEHELGLDFTEKDHPYNTDQEMWKEDFMIYFQEYLA